MCLGVRSTDVSSYRLISFVSLPPCSPLTPPPQAPSTSAAPEDLTPSEAPSVPTGVRIDASRVLQWYNDLVRTTEGCPVERLERVYTAMAKVGTAASSRSLLPTFWD